MSELKLKHYQCIDCSAVRIIATEHYGLCHAPCDSETCRLESKLQIFKCLDTPPRLLEDLGLTTEEPDYAELEIRVLASAARQYTPPRLLEDLNLIVTSGARDPLTPEAGARRYMVLDIEEIQEIQAMIEAAGDAHLRQVAQLCDAEWTRKLLDLLLNTQSEDWDAEVVIGDLEPSGYPVEVVETQNPPVPVVVNWDLGEESKA